MRVIYCWEAGRLDVRDYRTNPYGALLKAGLESRGHRVTGAPYYQLRFRDLFGNAGADVLHMNHLYHYYKHPWRLVSLLRMALLVLWVLLARILGMRIVWTLHNLYPHETRSRAIDKLARLLLCRMAGSAIVHCEKARAELEREFGRTHNVHVVPHGNYIDAYPPAISKKDARLALGLPLDTFVILYFGNVRAYKGIETLITAFGDADLAGAHLVIAGKSWPDSAGAEIEVAREAGAEGRITTILKLPGGTFDGDEICELMSAADSVVLPFRQVLSSGSVMLALSYSNPVVCPRLGCLTELLEDCEGAVLYDAGSHEGLVEALRTGSSLDPRVASRAALDLALEANWSSVAEKMERAYEAA